MVEKTMEEQIGELLLQRRWFLALAESCTGGLVSHRITNVPGSSSYYLGGITAYANETKMRLLRVSPDTLEKHGAVSRVTVLEMARGARQNLHADISMSISGIAGPGGGTPEKPVGLTWIGLCSPDWEHAWSYVWRGDRIQVKEQSAGEVLRLLRDYLAGRLTAG
jgi:PncC family amidohydrolase